MRMRMSEIRLRNYRQFRDVELALHRAGDSRIHILVGSNGTGKTNLLNALSWCLYDDEPHLTDQLGGLPLLNIATLAEMLEGETECVSVDVSFDSDTEGRFTFTRQHTYRLQDEKPIFDTSIFRVSYLDASGNTKFVEGDEAASYVERLVPRGIREYYFFDGERLDSYFKEEAGQRIRHAVFEISQIDILTTVERKLGEMLTEVQREAGRRSPEIEAIRGQLEEAQRSQNELCSRLEICDKQIRLAEQTMREYEEKLRRIPNVESLEDERGKLDSEIGSLGELLKEKQADKGDQLVHYGTILNVQPALQHALRIIEDKRCAGEIPPAVNRQLLEDSLAKAECAVCGTQLSGLTRDNVQALLEDIELSSDVVNELQRIEAPIRMLLQEAERLGEMTRRSTRDVEDLRGRLAKASGRRDEIDRELSGFDLEHVRQWAKSRREFEKDAKSKTETKGRLRLMLEEAERKCEKLQAEMRKALKEEAKVEELQRQAMLCSEAQNVAETAREQIANDVRCQIERRTNKVFMDLIWKRDTYERVEIDEGYNITPYHTAGYDALGSASAAERELLALSFTLALHEVSGFDAPLVIDTPVARVSDKHKENFAKVLKEVSTKGKQTLLLFTPDEYTSDISQWLESVAASKHEFRLQVGETETKLEDLTSA